MGKTSLIQAFMGMDYSEKKNTTIGVDFAKKVVRLNDNMSIRVQLWDTAGQEKYRSLATFHIRGALRSPRRGRYPHRSRSQ